MTPEVAERLRIHEQDEPASGSIRLAGASGGVAAVERSARRFRLIEVGQLSVPALVRREATHRRLLALGDVFAAASAVWLVMAVAGDAPDAGLTVLMGMPLVVLVFKLAGLYDRDQLRIITSTLDEAPQLIQLTGLYALTLTIAGSILLGGQLEGSEVAELWAAGFVLIAGARTAARWFADCVTRTQRCLVIGEAHRADYVREKLSSSGARATVVATFSLDDDIDPLDIDSVRRIVTDLRLDRIIIAPAATDAAGLGNLIRLAKAAGVQVSILPRMLEVVGSTVEFEDLDGATMLGVRPFGLSRSSRAIKRVFDFCATIVGLLAVAPLIAAVAVAIRLDSRGPIFFRQVRVGRDGRHFRIFKFRSMVVDADGRKDDLRSLNEVGSGMFKIAEDPRVTRVGRFLRRTSLDELPQLFNVLWGEMSLVGPRPLVVDEDAQVLGLDRSRLHLTPGMTGPWQVLGARVPMQEMVAIDYLYVAGWSLWVDVKIMVRTVRHVLRRGNV